MNIRNWLVAWFVTKLECTEDEINADSNFFEEQYIDSLKIFQLIIEIESTFKIKFDNSDFLDNKINSINGLTLLIEKRRK